MVRVGVVARVRVLLDLLELHPRRLAALQLLTLEVVPQRAPVARDDG